MCRRFRLARPARLWLRRLARKTREAGVRVRCSVLLKIHAGMSCAAAARALDCAPSSAARMVARCRRGGEVSVFDGRAENGSRKVDADVAGGILKLLEQSPPAYGYSRWTWTLELIAKVVAQELRVTLSAGHLGKLLHRWRVRWGRARPVAPRWARKVARRAARIAALRHLASQPPPGEVVVYADEVDIHLNPKIGFDWMLPGTQREIPTPGQNEKRYLAGAYDPGRQRLVYVAGDRKASWLFLNLLRGLQAAYRWVRRIHVILDNSIIHKSEVTRAWLSVHGAKLRLHFLPPYCQEENRIERLWLDLHANVTRNHQCRNMAELMANVHRYLQTRFDLAEVLAYAA
jgi:transposase